MAELGNLIVKIEADVSKLSKGLLDAEGNVKNFSKKTEQSLFSLENVFKFVFAERVVHYVTQAFQETVKYGDELQKLSIIANVSAGQIAKLQYAFEQEGGSAADLNRILPVLAKNIAEGAKGGNEMSSAFNKLGVETRDSNGNLKNVSTVFTELASKIGTMDDKTKALAYTMQIMGKGGREAFEILSKGGDNLKRLTEEFEAFGLGEDRINKFAKASDDLSDSFEKLKQKFTLAKIVIAEQLYPVLQRLVEKMIEFDWVKFGEDIGQIVGAFEKAAGALKVYLDYIEKFMGFYKQIGGGVMGMAGGAVGAMAGGGLMSNLMTGGVSGAAMSVGAGAGAGGAAGFMAPETTVTAQREGGEQGAGAQAQGGGDQKVTGIAGMLKAIKELPKALAASVKQMEKPLKDLDSAFTKLGKGIDATFQASFTAMMQGGESFSSALVGGFKQVGIEFASMIATMILKWTAFFLAVMAIALVLSAFGVPIGKTFSAAFKFLEGGGTADASSATGALKGAGSKFLGGFLGMRQGGALMARNGLMTAQTGIALTGGLGEGGIPVIAHPNEIIAPIDKVFEFMQKGTFGGGMSVTINGYNQDPRQLAETIMLEIERKRRNPF